MKIEVAKQRLESYDIEGEIYLHFRTKDSANVNKYFKDVDSAFEYIKQFINDPDLLGIYKSIYSKRLGLVEGWLLGGDEINDIRKEGC